MAWISTELKNIYYGAQCSPDDIEIPGAPGQHYNWDGSAWVHNAVAEQQSIIKELTSAVQNHLDATARARNYDGILSACTYATSTNSQFAVEGQACVQWRDACWFTCYGVMNAVQLGGRETPTADQLIAELPPMVWP